MTSLHCRDLTWNTTVAQSVQHFRSFYMFERNNHKYLLLVFFVSAAYSTFEHTVNRANMFELQTNLYCSRSQYKHFASNLIK